MNSTVDGAKKQLFDCRMLNDDIFSPVNLGLF